MTGSSCRNSVRQRLTRGLKTDFSDGTSDIIEKAATQFDEYFNGKRREFDIPLLFVGSDFQRKVWSELTQIPFGQTVSYKYIAEKLTMPQSVRAVANAIGANALSIFAPCHRVIGCNGSLTGYAGGVEAKQFLLDIEHS